MLIAAAESRAAMLIASGERTLPQLAAIGVKLMGPSVAMAVAQRAIDRGWSSMPELWREVIRLIRENHAQ